MKKPLLIIILMLALAPLGAAAKDKAKDKAKDAAAAVPTVAAKPVTTRYYMDISTVATTPSQQAPCVKLSLGHSVLAVLGISPGELNIMARDHMLVQPIDAMNFLSQYGWTLAHIYTEAERRGTATHWVVYKDAAHPTELLDDLADKRR